MKQEGPQPIPIGGSPGRRLDSWKEIAGYLRREIRTVQRWERQQDLPVHRHIHQKHSSVYASTAELDEWWRQRAPALDQESIEAPARSEPPSYRSTWALVGGAAIALTTIGLLAIRSWPSRVPFSQVAVTPLVTSGDVGVLALSSDGRYAVYSKPGSQGPSVWLRQVATTSTTQILPPSRGAIEGVAFSRDGDFLYMTKSRAVHRVPLLGGTPIKLIDDVRGPVSLSPDGKRFAFVRETEQESALFIARIDGTEPIRIASRKAPEFYQTLPAWSPDGRVIACPAGRPSGNGSSEMTVISVPVEGGAEKIISRSWWVVGGVAWLGDNRGLLVTVRETQWADPRLLYLSYPSGEYRAVPTEVAPGFELRLAGDSSTLLTKSVEPLYNIWSSPTDGDPRGICQLTTGPRGRDGSDGVAWMPDGRLLYTSFVSGARRLWVSNADGTDAKQLSDLDAADPSVCPDGRHILFDSNEGSQQRHVWRMDSDGSNPKRLTTAERNGWERVSFCGSDNRFAFYNALEQPGTIPPEAYSARIAKIPLEGGAPVYLTTAVRTIALGGSPDGSMIVGALSTDAREPAQLALFSPDGALIRQLGIKMGNAALHAAWLPDAKTLLYVATTAGVSNVWSVNTSSGSVKQITQFTKDQIRDIALSPDGKRMILSRGSFNQNAVMIRDLSRR